MKFRLSPVAVAITVVLLTISTAVACLWDSDTLAQERAKFPSALELIAGKFPRHSPAFYQWRIEDRQAKLESGDDQASYYDDIAVAHDKLRQDDQAIEWMHKKAAKFNDSVDNRYKTAANLGTFYLHSRQLDKGIEQLELAIQINPNAHFGRERYQLYLAKYIKLRLANGHLSGGQLILPLRYDHNHDSQVSKLESDSSQDTQQDHPHKQVRDFGVAVVYFDDGTFRRIDEKQTADAVTGILGMMRFGHYDSPVLLECLGDLLSETSSVNQNSAYTIAARAYMRAADLLPQEDEVSRDKYHELVNRVMHFKENQDQKDIRHFLKLELAEANEYYRQIVADEELWISQNADVEALFQAKYYASKDDQVRLNSHADVKPVINQVNTFAEVGVFVAITLLLFASICLYFLRRFLKKIAHQTTNKV
jgi:tetratricopeptide (TPR) repeat protein